MAERIISYVGAGGKTTSIFRERDRFLSERKKVFVTTTTHMWAEKDTLVDKSQDEILEELRNKGYVMAGNSSKEPGKIRKLDPMVYETICKESDIVLVEADGARGHYLKYPSKNEPELPRNTDEVRILMNEKALGKAAGDMVHRFQLMKEEIGKTYPIVDEIKAEDNVTAELINLLFQIYIDKIRMEFSMDKTLKMKKILIRDLPEEESY